MKKGSYGKLVVEMRYVFGRIVGLEVKVLVKLFLPVWFLRRMHMFDPINFCWREDVIKKTFLALDVERIRSIPISRRLLDDERCWTTSIDGVVRVRDAFRLAFDNENVLLLAQMAILWKLKIPPEVLNFKGRACWDIIPYIVNHSILPINGCWMMWGVLIVDKLKICFMSCATVHGSVRCGRMTGVTISFREWLAWILDSLPRNKQESFWDACLQSSNLEGSHELLLNIYTSSPLYAVQRPWTCSRNSARCNKPLCLLPAAKLAGLITAL